MNFPFGTVAPLTLRSSLADQIDLQGSVALRVSEPTKKVGAQILVRSLIRFISVALMFKGLHEVLFIIIILSPQKEMKLKATPTLVFVISPPSPCISPVR